jgi:hypothetical protein
VRLRVRGINLWAYKMNFEYIKSIVDSLWTDRRPHMNICHQFNYNRFDIDNYMPLYEPYYFENDLVLGIIYTIGTGYKARIIFKDTNIEYHKSVNERFDSSCIINKSSQFTRLK